MRTIEFPELENIRVELDEEFVTRQLAAISGALESVGPPTKRHRLAGWRRWMASVAVGASALVPAAAAASDSAVPGDALYSVKRVLEPLVQLVNGEVVAEHRIEELEVLEVLELDRADQDVFDSLLQEATDAVARIDSPTLSDRLDAIVDRRRDAVRDTQVEPLQDDPQTPPEQRLDDQRGDRPRDAGESEPGRDAAPPGDDTQSDTVQEETPSSRSDADPTEADEEQESDRDQDTAPPTPVTTTAPNVDGEVDGGEPPTEDVPTTEPEADPPSDRP